MKMMEAMRKTNEHTYNDKIMDVPVIGSRSEEKKSGGCFAKTKINLMMAGLSCHYFLSIMNYQKNVKFCRFATMVCTSLERPMPIKGESKTVARTACHG